MSATLRRHELDMIDWSPPLGSTVYQGKRQSCAGQQVRYEEDDAWFGIGVSKATNLVTAIFHKQIKCYRLVI
jgi:hypothetical protein